MSHTLPKRKKKKQSQVFLCFSAVFEEKFTIGLEKSPKKRQSFQGESVKTKLAGLATPGTRSRVRPPAERSS